MRGRILTGLLGLLVAGSALAGEAFQVDRAHSHVNFEIRHLISTVTGSFRDFAGTIDLDRADLAKSSVDFTIQTASIDTGQEGRDKHLRSPDFFDAEKFPQITFKSKRIIQKSTEYYDVVGDFSMHGVTKEIILPVKVLGITKGPRGGDLAGFKVDFVLDRKDYGIAWNKDYQAGLLLLGDTVDVRISLETGPPPPPKPAEKPAEEKK
jgi:polyisoprenoid-binding protein YceI